MAQALPGAFIDLTGEDDNDDSMERAHAACEKAVAAASRLTNHVESFKPPKPTVHQSPNKNVDSTRKDSFPATASKTKFLPLPGMFSNPVRSDIDKLKENGKKPAILRQTSSVPSPGVSAPQSALSIGASRPASSPSISERMGGKKLPRETTSVTPRPDTFTTRTPRSAAISAKQNIAEACSELEEWVNKDPKLILQQAGVSTPRRAGRPNDDLDEWSPNSIANNKEEERKGLDNMITGSPRPLSGKHEDLTANGDNSLSHAQGISTSLGSRKRRFSRSSESRGSPLKVARWDEEPSARRESTPPNLAEPTDRKHVHNGTSNSSPAGVFPRCVYPAIKLAKAEYKQSLTEDDLAGIGKSITNHIVEQGLEAFCPASANCPKNQRTELILKSVSESFHERVLRVRNGLPINLIASTEGSPKGLSAPFLERDLKASRLERRAPGEGTVKMNNKLPSDPPKADSGENGVSAKPTMIPTHEKIDPRLQRGFYEASNPTISEPGPDTASPIYVKYTLLFESVVYPAIKKSKKRHKDSVSREDLDAIGKIIINEVIKRLATHSEDSQQLDEDTKKKIKYFVKKSFRQRVRKANAQSSHNSAAPANDSKVDVAYLPSSSGLGALTEGHRPPTAGLNHFQNASSSQAIAANDNNEGRAPQQPQSKPLNQQISLSSQQSPTEAPTSPFGPDFDRGRYPALRRRRGNKYFTPTRPSKTAPKLDNGHSISSIDRTLTTPASSQHSNEPGVLDSRDQVGLLKASANQPSARAAQLTAFASDIGEKRTLTNGNSASEPLASIEGPTDLGHLASEPASYADVTEALQEVLAQGQGRTADVGDMPASSRGPIFPHIANSRKNTAINQLSQRIPRKSQLKDVSPQRELRPYLCPKPATGLDPSLEHVVAVSVTDTSSAPSKDGQRYLVTHRDQLQLVTDQSIVKHVGLTSKIGKQKLVRIETKVVDPVRQPGRCISSLLRNRELGLTSRGRQVGTIGELRQLKSEMIEPWKNWKGASGDVVAVAWNSDSNMYAFGAAAHTNIEDIQYNRPCNLLLGNLTSNQIRELPDHRVDRPKPETIPNGPNASQAVYDACDPKVYETVTSVAFSPTGDRMLTASHDCTVKIWDVSAGKHECLSTLRHEAWVTSIEVSEHRQGLFATASKCVKDAVRIYHDPTCYVNFSASRAEARPEWKIYPECLRWGPNPYTSHLLLAGFQQWEQQGDLLSGGGQLCLWDAYALESIKVTPASQSVYAAAWHPTQPFFATGGAPGINITDKINTKTVVRTWDVRTPKRCQVEYECPATDMQDITFSPLDSNIVTAGCTDGSTYVWDWRWPEQLLHRLKHGRPLAELDHTKEREEADTGVMLSLWGPGGSLFYTGSSDGMIKAWDVRRHPNDVLVRNVANFDISIQSGAFSPDGNNLLVGDAEGGIHVLSSAPCGPRSNVKSTDAYIELVRASDGSGAKLEQGNDNPGTEGIEAARSLVGSGQLEYHKELGVGQGPHYQGPYASYARKEDAESGIGRLRKRYEKKQPISKRGEKRWDIAIPMTSLLYERKATLDREKDGKNIARDGPNERHSKLTTLRSKGGETVQTRPSLSTPEEADSRANDEHVGAIGARENEHQGVEYNTISEEEMTEENFWWARLGEEEIEQARSGGIRN